MPWDETWPLVRVPLGLSVQPVWLLRVFYSSLHRWICVFSELKYSMKIDSVCKKCLAYLLTSVTYPIADISKYFERKAGHVLKSLMPSFYHSSFKWTQDLSAFPAPSTDSLLGPSMGGCSASSQCRELTGAPGKAAAVLLTSRFSCLWGFSFLNPHYFSSFLVL